MKITFEIVDNDLNTLLERYKNESEMIEFVIENTLRNHIDEVEKNLKLHSKSIHATKEREWAKGFSKAFSDAIKELGWERVDETDNGRER